jgi:hypothetical protein
MSIDKDANQITRRTKFEVLFVGTLQHEAEGLFHVLARWWTSAQGTRISVTRPQISKPDVHSQHWHIRLPCRLCAPKVETGVVNILSAVFQELGMLRTLCTLLLFQAPVWVGDQALVLTEGIGGDWLWLALK